MKFNRKIFANPHALEEAAIRKAGFEKTMESLLLFYRGWERRSYLDHEVLWYAGLTVAKAGHESVDEHTYSWFERTPTMKRCEVAFSFLWGYWGICKRVHLPAVREMVNVLEEFPKDSFAYSSILLALYSVVTSEKTNLSDEQRQKSREVLLSHLDYLENIKAQEGIVALLEHLRE